MSPDFQRAQTEATKLLLRQDVNQLKIDVRRFKYDKRIIIDSVQHYAALVKQDISCFITKEFNGSCLLKYKDRGLFIVLYDENEPNEEKKHWGITHEIGHIYLGHEKDDDIEEIEAHFFAAQIIAPEIVLLYFAKLNHGHLESYDIYSNFNCSLQAAQKRIKTLSSYHWSNTLYDQQLLSKFKPLVEKQFAYKQT